MPGLVQFTTPDDKDWWRKNSGPVPGPQTDRLCELARKVKQWLIPGSMWEMEEGKMYNTAAGSDFCVFDIPAVGRFGLCICYDK